MNTTHPAPLRERAIAATEAEAQFERNERTVERQNAFLPVHTLVSLRLTAPYCRQPALPNAVAVAGTGAAASDARLRRNEK